jgi:hypothetical protein
MRWLTLLLGFALLSLGVCACGGASKSTGSTTKTSTTQASSSVSAANAPDTSASGSTSSSKSAVDPDHDDYVIEDYGHAASATEKRTVTALVKRYYAAALASDGATACSMLMSSLAKAIPEDYGRSPGPPALRGSTCSGVISKLFKSQHQQLAAEVATMAVARVRVNGNHAFALLAFRTTPEPRDIGLSREAGNWKISGLLDGALP